MDSDALAVLKAVLDSRHGDILRLYERVEERKPRLRGSDESIDSMAYQIHNLYGAFEQLFEEIARAFENQIDDERYHTDLPRRMKLEIAGIRPALISAQTFELLDGLRRFRHFFRHAYAVSLDSEKVADVVDRAEQLQELFRQDLERFLAQLSP